MAASVGVLLTYSGPTPRAVADVAPGSTVLVSVSDAGIPAPTAGFDQEMSYDGTAVTFVSQADLGGPEPAPLADGEQEQVYVRDMARNRTVLISRGQFAPPSPPTSGSPVPGFGGRPMLNLAGQPAAERPTNGDSFEPTISADGRFVAFLSTATNIVDGDEDDVADIILCDRSPNGTFDERKPDGRMNYRYYRLTHTDGDNYVRYEDPHLSADASRIVWQQIPGESGRRVATALLRSPGTGQIGAPVSIQELSNELPQEQGGGTLFDHSQPRISADGRFVVSVGRIDNEDGEFYVVARTDIATNRTIRVDFEADGTPVSPDTGVNLRAPVISGDGSVIAFVASRTTGQPNVYVVRPGTNAPEIVSRDIAGNTVNGALPGLSADGRYLAFVTDAFRVHDGVDVGPPSNFTCLDSNESTFAMAPPDIDEARDVRTRCHVVVRDLTVDRARAAAGQPRLPAALASVPRDTTCTDGNAAANRCPGDSTPSDFASPPSVSDNGRVAFDSTASDLADKDTPFTQDSYVHTFEPTLVGAPVVFGTVTIGTNVSRSATLDHVGFGPLVVESVSVTGSQDFTVGPNNCTVLHTTGNCLVSVKFTPTASGDRTGQLVVRVRGGRTFAVDLRGSGTPEVLIPPDPVFAAGPDPIDFGDRLMLSDGPAIALTVRNAGGSPMTVTGVTIDVPTVVDDYTVDPAACLAAPIAPGASCVVQVRFSPRGPAVPGAPDVRTATLRFTGSAPGGPHLVAVRGKVIQPSLEVNPAVLAPGRVTMASGMGFPPGKTVTLRFASAVGDATATVGADGRFAAQLLVFPKASVGQRQVVATVDGVVPAIFAERPLLVVINTVSPAEFVGRG
jgi:Tol biopolymer transport system component